MAETIGALTIAQRALPTGVDAARLAMARLQRDGMTYGELVNRLSAGLADLNAELLNKWGYLLYLTDEDHFEYEDGGSVTPLPEITDVDITDNVHGTTIAHSLDVREYGRGIASSKMALRKLRPATMNATISTIVRQTVWRVEQLILTRMFTDDENLLGTSGYDVGFVTSSGNVVYTPPAYNGQTFASHSHYLGHATGGSNTWATFLNLLVESLQEHGHDAPYEAIVSRADVTNYRALADFVQIVDPNIIVNIDRGGATSGAQYFSRPQQDMSVIGRFQSDYGVVTLRETGRVATGYASVFKSYGNNDARNPIALGVDPDVGFGAYIVPEFMQDNQYPVKQVKIAMQMGTTCGRDRTNGVTGYFVSGGAWADATVS